MASFSNSKVSERGHMVTITMHGLLSGAIEGELHDLSGDLERAIAKIEALNLNLEKVRFIFPQSMSTQGPGEEISVFADGLMIERSVRADDARKELSRQIVWTTKMRFPNASVQCIIRPFDPTAGFWASNGQEHQ